MTENKVRKMQCLVEKKSFGQEDWADLETSDSDKQTEDPLYLMENLDGDVPVSMPYVSGVVATKIKSGRRGNPVVLLAGRHPTEKKGKNIVLPSSLKLPPLARGDDFDERLTVQEDIESVVKQMAQGQKKSRELLRGKGKEAILKQTNQKKLELDVHSENKDHTGPLYATKQMKAVQFNDVEPTRILSKKEMYWSIMRLNKIDEMMHDIVSNEKNTPERERKLKEARDEKKKLCKQLECTRQAESEKNKMVKTNGNRKNYTNIEKIASEIQGCIVPEKAIPQKIISEVRNWENYVEEIKEGGRRAKRYFFKYAVAVCGNSVNMPRNKTIGEMLGYFSRQVEKKVFIEHKNQMESLHGRMCSYAEKERENQLDLMRLKLFTVDILFLLKNMQYISEETERKLNDPLGENATHSEIVDTLIQVIGEYNRCYTVRVAEDVKKWELKQQQKLLEGNGGKETSRCKVTIAGKPVPAFVRKNPFLKCREKASKRLRFV